MEAWEYWKLSNSFNLNQAALLIIGIDPSKINGNIHEWHSDYQPEGFQASLNGLVSAIENKEIYSDIVYIKEEDNPYYSNETMLPVNKINYELTKVSRVSIEKFLKTREIKSIFFPEQQTELDPENPFCDFYSEKLAAAIAAWKAICNEPHRLNKCTPKQAIETWLRENAALYNLVKKDGKLNEKGIEEISKVTNWRTKGGAPNLTSTYESPKPKTLDLHNEIDEDFPF